MSPDDIRQTVLRSLKSLAPEVDVGAIPPTEDLREALDIDSMDFLRFVVDLHDTLHVDIPESDYAKVRTLDGCVSYLATRVS